MPIEFACDYPVTRSYSLGPMSRRSAQRAHRERPWAPPASEGHYYQLQRLTAARAPSPCQAAYHSLAWASRGVGGRGVAVTGRWRWYAPRERSVNWSLSATRLLGFPTRSHWQSRHWHCDTDTHWQWQRSARARTRMITWLAAGIVILR